ncbi:MAG: hypothetical protein LUE64_01840 [Candidatus Gastranaerophilales bacterium]|nr:hypothetical protein [Candidatus Gastranaerophilales bacterium]
MSDTNIYSNTSSGNTYYYYIDSNGDEWYSASKEDLEKVQNGTDASTLSTVYSSEDKLVAAEFSDDETDDTTTTTSATNSTSATGTYGYDTSSYDTYSSSIGLSDLTDSSKIKDYQAVLDQIEEEITSLQDQIDSLDTSDPEAVNEALSNISTKTSAVMELSEKAGTELKLSNYTAATIGVCAVGATGLLMAGGYIGGSTALATLGTVAVTANVVPVAGQIIAAGACIAMACITVAKIYQNHQKNQLEDDIQAAYDNLEEMREAVEEKTKEEVEGIIDEANSNFGDIINDGYTIDSIDDVPDAVEQLSNITEYQESLAEWKALADAWGIEIEGLDDAIANLETAQENVRTGVITKAQEDVQQINTDIAGLLDSSGNFNFDDIADINTLISNIDLIIDGQAI